MHMLQFKHKILQIENNEDWEYSTMYCINYSAVTACEHTLTQCKDNPHLNDKDASYLSYTTG